MNEAFIFKYCSLSTAVKIIEDQSLKFSNPKSFNDPFDCDIDLLEFNFSEKGIEIDQDLEKLKVALLVQYGKEKSELVNKLSNSRFESIYRNSQLKKIDKSSVCCFSLDYSNKVMWSHYSDQHKGVCLIFDLDCEEPFLDFNSERITQGFVNYKDYEPINYLSSKRNGIIRLFLTKSKDWEYEKEFRIMIFDESGLFKFKKEFLKGVILGLRATDEDFNNLKALSKIQGFDDLMFARFVKEKLDMKLSIE
jgi:hypothetical protein